MYVPGSTGIIARFCRLKTIVLELANQVTGNRSFWEPTTLRKLCECMK